MANKKITELTELTAANIANNDVLAIVDVGGDETKKVAISSLYDIFDNNVTIDTAKIIYGLTGANTNISALSVNTLPLSGGTITGPVISYSINSSSNVSIAQSLAIGYVDHRVPQANLDVKDNVYIGGATTIAGALILGTDLAVAQGGTGVSSLTDGGVLLGSGTNAITAMGVLGDGEFIVGDGTTDPVAESGATLRTSVGVGTGDSPQFTAVNIGAATDTTVARASAGDINVEGNLIYRAGGTDVPVADGGTGTSSLTDGGLLLGSGTNAITAMGVLTDGQMIVGDSSTDPVAESGATLRTSVGVGTGDTPQFYGANVSGNASINRSLAVGYTDGRVPQANLEVKGNTYISGATTIAGALILGTDLAVTHGGTGASSFTDGGVLLGSGTSAITAMAVLTDGQMIVGDGTTDPVAESGATLRTSIGVGTGDSPQFTAVNIGAATDTTVARASAGDLNVEGNLIYRAGGTDVPVADGGTGASSLTDGGVLLGSGTNAITAMGVLSDGQMIVGDGSTDPVAESGATLRTSIGVGVGDSLQFLNLTVNGNLTVKGNNFIVHANNLVIDDPIISLAANLKSSQSPADDTGILLNRGNKSNVFAGYDESSNSYVIAYTPTTANSSPIDIGSYSTIRVGALTADSLTLGTDLAVAQGGTGASTFTDGGVLLGSGASAITAMGVLSDSEMIVGDGTTDPVAESGDTLRNSIGVGTTASGTVMQISLANTSGNVRVARNLAIGYANLERPGANLDVNGNAYVSGSVVSSGETLQGESDVMAIAVAFG